LHGDQVLLVHGGASGIGTAAVQIANALGHRVLATVGSDERARKIEALGASLGVNYRTTDFVTAVKEATNGRGANVILDMVGGGYVRRNMECVADEGRIVSIARLGGNIGEVNIGDLIRKRAIITGSTLRPRSVEFKALISEALRVVVWPLLESGKIRSVVHATFPFEMAEAAHRMMEEGSHVGKLILTMDH
jgi:NADPH:quinone reductase